MLVAPRGPVASSCAVCPGCRRLNDTIADQKQKYEAQILQHQQAAAAAQDTLQATTRQLLEVQKQLEEAQAAGADARKQRDDAVQLQVATREQLNALGATHKVSALGSQLKGWVPP